MGPTGLTLNLYSYCLWIDTNIEDKWLLVNARDEGKLVQIIADKVKCWPESGKIPFVVGAGSKPFLG